MLEAFSYIPSAHFINLLKQYRSFSMCKSNQHGYTCYVKTESQSQSFAVIKEGAEETYVYYDTQAAQKRTQLHPKNGREYATDHVLNRVTDSHLSPRIIEYLQQHKDRFTADRDDAPDPPLLGTFPQNDGKHLYDIAFNDEDTVSEREIQEAFVSELGERHQQLNSEDLDEARGDQFGKMFGWRIEPLQKRYQPDIVLELILLGAYEQVFDTMAPR